MEQQTQYMHASRDLQTVGNIQEMTTKGLSLIQIRGMVQPISSLTAKGILNSCAYSNLNAMYVCL